MDAFLPPLPSAPATSFAVDPDTGLTVFPGGVDGRHENIVTSPFDTKRYRIVRLDNGLVALLIHDPDDPDEKGASGNGGASEDEDDHGKDGDDDDDDDDDEYETEDEERAEDGDAGDSQDDDGNDGEDDLDADDDDDDDEEDDEEDDPKSRGKKASKRRSAAAMTVGVGSFHDPPGVQGLAHFLEHMLFMGSEKYPDENAFDSFIRKHGGYDNASTDSENTVFQFDIVPESFYEALDIFAQFFIRPLMKEETLTREIQAVDSEFSMALTSDSNRKQQLLCSAAKPSHPMHGFGWGNAATLSGSAISPGDLRRELLAFHAKHYHAGVMRLCVLGQEPLDTLESWVRGLFSAIPASPPSCYAPFAAQIGAPMPSPSSAALAGANQGLPCILPIHSFFRGTPPFGDHESAYDLLQFSTIAYAEAIKEMHELTLTWILPALQSLYLSSPLLYISDLIGHEGPGSIYALLVQQGWATSLYAGSSSSGYEQNSSFWSFQVVVSLTDLGLDHVPDVLLTIFQYIRMLDALGPQERIFREQQAIASMSFKFQETSEPVEYVEQLAINLQYYPDEHVICGPSLYFRFDPATIASLLKKLSAHTVNIILISKKAAQLCGALHRNEAAPMSTDDGSTRSGPAAPHGKFERLEPWFSLPYTERSIPAAWREAWASCSAHPSLHLPAPNEFIATDFDIVSEDHLSQSTAIDALANVDARLSPLDSSSGGQAFVSSSFSSAAAPAPYESISDAMRIDAGLDETPPPRQLFPVLVSQTPLWNIWHKPDSDFKLPRANLYFVISGPSFNNCARASVLTDLHVTMLDHLVKEFSYAADIAEISFSLQHIRAGLLLKLSGFNHKLPVLFGKLVACIARISDTVRDEDFKIAVNRMQRRYMNADIKPEKRSRSIRLDILQQRRYTIPERLAHLLGGVVENPSVNAAAAAANAPHADPISAFPASFISQPPTARGQSVPPVSLQELKAHVVRCMQSVFCEVLVQGNMTRAQSLRLMDVYSSTLFAAPSAAPKLHISQLPQELTTQLAPGSVFLVAPGQNPEDDNSVVEVYYQFDALSLVDFSAVLVLESVMVEPCFDVLRTKEQLGYDVSCTCRCTGGITGFGFQVQSQSSKFSVGHIHSRIEAFLLDTFFPKLERLTNYWLRHVHRAHPGDGHAPKLAPAGLLQKRNASFSASTASLSSMSTAAGHSAPAGKHGFKTAMSGQLLRSAKRLPQAPKASSKEASRGKDADSGDEDEEESDQELYENFQDQVDSLVAIKLQKLISLTEEADRNWSEIADAEYLFDRHLREVQVLRTITPVQVLAVFKKYLLPGAARRKLAVAIVGKTEWAADRGETSKGDILAFETKLQRGEYAGLLDGGDSGKSKGKRKGASKKGAGARAGGAANNGAAGVSGAALLPNVTFISESSMFDYKSALPVHPPVSRLQQFLSPELL